VEIFFASVLITFAFPLFVLGIIKLLKKEVTASRFAVQKYNSQLDKELKQLKEKQKKSEIPLSRHILMLFTGGVFFGGIIYLIVGIGWAAIVGSLLGLIIPKLWLNWQKAGYKKLITSQLEQAVEIMAAVLRSGGGILASLDKAIEEIPNPLKRELERVAAEIKLGVPASQAFISLTERVPIQEMSMLSMAVNLQETGMSVNMASVFDQIQINIRSRQAFQEELRVLVAENKMAGWVVGTIPFITISIMRHMAPEFTKPLFSTALGLTVFVSSTVVILIGLAWIMQMTKVENT
jgi:tight adherence protein B